MLKFYDYNGNERPKEYAINYSIKYIIVETEHDEAILEQTIDMYIQNNQGNMLYNLVKSMEGLRENIKRRHIAMDCVIDKGVPNEVQYLSYPNVWVFNNLSGAWALSNHIIHDITKLNAKLKSKSKTENQIRNSNSDSKSEIENEN